MTILIIGAVCIVAAIVGGGLKGVGWEFPVLTSRVPRVLLAGTGIVFVAIGLIQDFSMVDPNRNASQAKAPSTTTTSTQTAGGAISTSSTVIAASTTHVRVEQTPTKSYQMTAAYGVAINLDNGKQVAWTRVELPPGADLYVGNFKRIGAQAGFRLHRLLDDDPLAACRASIDDNTLGERSYLVEDLAKGDVICTDTDQGRIALLTIVALPRDLNRWTGGLVLDVRLWPL